ncbi:MAG: 16S rRNA (cytidine(1402)-2'-O)-methyltransferase [Candidatus Kapabacteria bacterium]|nr:16S rRNA (cytidine(1402)-2'-O)-methyltransferase [Candidatus Kapabacteria bacterium]
MRKFENEDLSMRKKIEIEEPKVGKLYIISTPIGNEEDITQRAIRLLKLSDLIVCEEFRVGAQLLKTHNIRKDLDNLNEQNETQRVAEYIKKMKEGTRIGLISDCGTPVFADPGANLVSAALAAGIEIEVAPGVTSIMAALVRSGLPIDKFYYAGFVSQKTELRIEALKALERQPHTVVLLETPYRLRPFLDAACEVMPERRAYIGMNLTTLFETHHYGTFEELKKKFETLSVRAEVVICFEGRENNVPVAVVPFREDRNKFKPTRTIDDNDDKEFGYRGGKDKKRKEGDFKKDRFRGFGREERPPRPDGDMDAGDRPPRRESIGDGERPKRAYSSSSEDRPKREYTPRSSEDRPKREYTPRSSEDRPKREYSSRSSEDRPKREYSSRSSEDRPKREYSSRSSEDRPKREYTPRSSEDRPKREYTPRSSEDRPKRIYSSTRVDGPKREYTPGTDRTASGSDDKKKRWDSSDRESRAKKFEKPEGDSRPRRSGGIKKGGKFSGVCCNG